MRIDKIKNEDVIVFPRDLVKVRRTGDVTEVLYADKRNFKPTILKIDKEHYVSYNDFNPTTGEIIGDVKKIQHNENRADDMRSVARSIKNLRDLINCNCTEPDNLKWITLTYRQRDSYDQEPVPMTDTVRLYNDFKKFMKKVRYYYGSVEYIVACEPQGSGSWHAHLILIFDKKAPFIPNDKMSEMWSQGFTKTEALDSNVDNLGAYLSAYLGDMRVEEADKLHIGGVIKEVDGKRYVKGARLKLYPPGFNLYRASRGIKRPEEFYTTWEKAQKEVSTHTLTYEKSRLICDDATGYENKLNYKYYNKKRPKKQKAKDPR